MPTTTAGSTGSEAGTATDGATVAPTTGTSSGPETTDGTTGPDATCVDTPPPGFAGRSDPTCAAAPQVGTFQPILEWNRGAWATAPTSDQVLMSPIVASLDGDDVPDVAFVTYVFGDHYGPGVLRAMSGDGQKEVLNVEGQDVCGHSGLAAGDIDGDGQVELVVVTTGGAVKVFEHDGTPKWTSPTYMLHCSTSPGIADFDGDGSPEVFAGAVILDADGNERGVGPHGNGFRISLAADIDEDGQQELVVGNAAYDGLGGVEWFNMESDGIPGVADFTGDSKPEIVVSAAGTVRLQDNAGVVLWTSMVPGGGGGAPTIADYDGDGEPETGVAGSEYYVVFDTDGSLMWQAPISETESATGSIVYDFEGDGVANVIHADENRVWVFSGVDGAVKLEFAGHGSATQLESPAVANVDGDGQVEIVFGNNQFYDPAAPKGISVIGDEALSWRPGRKIWNQFAYSITNVADDGTIPAMPVHNWTAHNNYRSGDDSPPDGTAAPERRARGVDLPIPVPGHRAAAVGQRRQRRRLAADRRRHDRRVRGHGRAGDAARLAGVLRGGPARRVRDRDRLRRRRCGLRQPGRPRRRRRGGVQARQQRRPAVDAVLQPARLTGSGRCEVDGRTLCAAVDLLCTRGSPVIGARTRSAHGVRPHGGATVMQFTGNSSRSR
ncbi:FG-GAP repeat domain-containing protein [Nannocystis pusilla]|uniref:FG-GAP repeat domain-containing protein n=1 Tax=Nannocystis pusilla TaxID=889268 RepID=UPI003DA53946